jgi:hypothetical protein
MATVALDDVRVADLAGFAVYGFQTISQDAITAGGLTVPAGSVRAWLDVQTQAVRWRADGTSPTTSVGSRLTAGSSLIITGDALMSAIEFIAETGTAEINVHYFGI